MVEIETNKELFRLERLIWLACFRVFFEYFGMNNNNGMSDSKFAYALADANCLHLNIQIVFYFLIGWNVCITVTASDGG